MSKMVLKKVAPEEVPPGATILSENEVFEYYYNMFTNWKPQSEVWALRYGSFVLGFICGATNFHILRQYQRRLKLNHGLFIGLGLSCAVVPSLISPTCHIWYVTRKILLGEECYGCLHIHAMGIQVLSALTYSLTVNPLLCFMKAQQVASYRVPGYSTPEQRRQSWQLYLKFTKRASKLIYGHFMLNTLAATLITVQEINQFAHTQESLIAKEEEVNRLKRSLEKTKKALP